MNKKTFAKKVVKEAEEDELRELAKLQHARDWKTHVETFGADYFFQLA